MEPTDLNPKDSETLDRRISELDESVLSMQDSLAAMTDIIDSLVEFKRTAETTISKPQAGADLSAISRKLDAIAKVQENLRIEMAQIKQSSKEPEGAHERTGAAMGLLEELSSKVEEAKPLGGALAGAKQANGNLRNSIADANKTISRIESLLKQKTEAKEEKKAEDAEVLIDLRSKMEQLEDKLQYLSEQSADNEATAKLSRRVEALEGKAHGPAQGAQAEAMVNLRSKIEELEEKIQDLSAQGAETEAGDASALKEGIDKAAAQFADASYDITTLQEKSRILEDRITSNSDFSKNQFEKILSILRTKTEIIDRISKESEKTRKDASNALLASEDIKVQTEKRLDSMYKRLKANMESTAELDSKMNSQLEAIRAGLEGSLAEFSTQLANASPDKVKEVSNMVAEDRMLIGKLTILIKKMQDTYDPTRINSMKMKVERLENILKDLEEGKSSIMDRVTTLDDQLAKVDLGRIISLVDKVETVRNEIGQLSSSMALPADIEKRVSNLQDKVRYIEMETQKQANMHKTLKELDSKMAVMKEHVRSIKDEVKAKKNIPVHIGKEYLLLD